MAVWIAVAALVLLALSGCTATPAPAAPTRPGTSASTPDPTGSAGTLAIPATGPHEITRSTFRDGSVVVASATLPRTSALYVIVRCAGAPGSTVHYALQSGTGAAFGPSGDAACNGAGTTTGQSAAGQTLPEQARVDLRPGPGATAAYAVLATEPDE